MAIKVIDHEYNGQTTKQLNFKDAEPEDSFEFSLLYDKPLTGQSQWGAWYKFTIELHAPETISPVTFFSPKRAADGRLIGEVLSAYGKGARFKLTAKFRKTAKGSFYLVWDVVVVSGQPTTQQSGDATIEEQQPRTIVKKSLSEYHEEIVRALVNNSGGAQQSEEWLRKQLVLVGVKDEFVVQELLSAYEERFNGVKTVE